MRPEDVIADVDWPKLRQLTGMSHAQLRHTLTTLFAAFDVTGYEVHQVGPPAPAPPRERRVIVHVVSDEQKERLRRELFEVMAETADLRDMGEEISYEQELDMLLAAVEAGVSGQKVTSA